MLSREEEIIACFDVVCSEIDSPSSFRESAVSPCVREVVLDVGEMSWLWVRREMEFIWKWVLLRLLVAISIERTTLKRNKKLIE